MQVKGSLLFTIAPCANQMNLRGTMVEYEVHNSLTCGAKGLI